jgi:hypothetical protein
MKFIRSRRSRRKFLKYTLAERVFQDALPKNAPPGAAKRRMAPPKIRIFSSPDLPSAKKRCIIYVKQFFGTVSVCNP